MIGEINQDNLYLILPSKVGALASMLVEYKRMTVIDAIRRIYASKLYRRLQDESSKMWHWGPVALYEELEEEVMD